MVKFFTKKVGLILLAVVIAVGGVIWAIVANLQPKFDSGITTIPTATSVSGNGTASVLVDDYLYFIGDSVTTSSIKYGDNEYYANGKMPDTGIYRVRIEDSKPVVSYKYDNTYTNDDGETVKWQPGEEGYNTNVNGVEDWENIGKKNNGIQAVVPKIAGHDQSAMWVFGKYLIYTSPHNRYDNRGNLLSNYLDFFRVDLDGKNHTLLYTTDSADLTTKNFTLWANSVDQIFILVHETTQKTIKKINVKTAAVTTLDSEVSDVVLPVVTQYVRNSVNETLDKVYGGVMSYVYYTKARDDDFMGNKLYSCSIIDGTTKIIVSDGNGSTEQGSTFKPLAVTPSANGNAQFVFLITVKNSSTTIRARLGMITNKSMDDYTYVEPTDAPWALLDNQGNVKDLQIYANGFCTIDGNLYYYQTNGMDFEGELTDLQQNVDQVLAVFGNTAYVKKNTMVYEITPGKTTDSISIVNASNTESDDSSTDSSTITLPVAILSQPHGDQGKPIVFVQDASQIRLYHVADGKCNYLKFKQS